MQIEQTENYNSSFKALYMSNKNKIAKKYGYLYSKYIEQARPELKKLAQDVDIFVKNKKEGFKIIITEKFDLFFRRIFGSNKGNINFDINFYKKRNNLTEEIINKTKEAKENYILYNLNNNEYNSQF